MGNNTKRKMKGAGESELVPRRITKRSVELSNELANQFPITAPQAIELALVEVVPIWRERGTITIEASA